MDEWITIECERALYVDQGRDVILCDRIPGDPPTVIVKLSAEAKARLVAELTKH